MNWGRLVLSAIPTAAVAVGLAFCLSAMYDRGWYQSPFVAVGAALPMMLMTYLGVVLAHCRNRSVACLYAVLFGLLLYFGHFYIDFRSRAGPRAAGRIDLLLEHTARRVNNDTGWLQDEMAEHLGDGKKNQKPETRAAFNWSVFALDGLILVVLPALVAVVKAGRAYCESCRGWLSSQKVYGSNEHGDLVAGAVDSGEFDDLPAIPTLPEVKDAEYAIFRLEYCAPEEPRIACGRAYLTVKDFRLQLLPLRTLVRQATITAEELAALARNLTAFLSVATLIAGEAATDSQAGERPAGESQLAVVEAAPYEWGVASTWDRIVRFLLANVPGAVLVAGIAMIAAGLWRRPWNAGVDGWLAPETLIWLGGGAAVALAGGLVSWLNEDILCRRLSRRITRERIAWHFDSLVDPDDAAALYVEIVPRKHWDQLDHDRPSEVGLLVVDPQQGELRFEGSKWRYRLPGAAIVSCQVEPIEASPGWAIAHATVVRARASRHELSDSPDDAPTGPLELPFVQPPMTLVTSARIRQAKAENLQRRIHEVMPPEAS